MNHLKVVSWNYINAYHHEIYKSISVWKKKKSSQKKCILRNSNTYKPLWKMQNLSFFFFSGYHTRKYEVNKNVPHWKEKKKNQPLQGRRGWPFGSFTGDWSKVWKQQRKSCLHKLKMWTGKPETSSQACQESQENRVCYRKPNPNRF